MRIIISEEQSKLIPIRIKRRFENVNRVVKNALWIIEYIWGINKTKYPNVEKFIDSAITLIMSNFYLENSLNDLDDNEFKKFVEYYYIDDITSLYHKMIQNKY